MAARFFVNGGIDNNWGSTSNWSTTSGGAGGSAVPTTSDDVTLDTNSPNCIINVAAVCKTITASTYTHTLTLNNTLGISPASTNTLTFGASMSLAGSSTLTLTGPTSATASITTNGLVFSVPVTFKGNTATFTLNDNFNVSGLLTFNSGNITLNGNTIFASGSMTHTAGSTRGTTLVTASGTGTWTYTGGNIQFDFTINTSGTITFSSAFTYDTGTLTYTAGTVVAPTTLTLTSGAITLNCSGITWNNVTWLPLSSTITLSADFNISGNFSATLSGTCSINGAFNFNCGGNVTISSGTALSGTSTLVFTGTGTFASTTGTNKININFNTSGTITLSGTINYNTGILSYTSGTIAGGNITLTGNTTIDFRGGTLPGLVCTTAGVAITLNSGLLISNTFTMNGTNASPITISSNVGGTQRKLTMVASSAGVSQDVIYCNPTDIDSGDGVTVYGAKDTLVNTINWVGVNPAVAKKGGVVVIGGGTTTLYLSGFTGGVFGG